MIRKKGFLLLIILLMMTLFPMVLYAHPASQEGILSKSYIEQYEGYDIGGDDVGWSIDEDHHAESSTITYSFDTNDPNLTNTYKAYVAVAANTWSGTVTFINKTDGSGTGMITTYNDPNDDSVAEFINYRDNTDNDGHLLGWTIQINTGKSIEARYIAHELGHAIGLNDLYASASANKLMYGFLTGSANAPTSSDIWGAKVITGIHTAHTWGYKYESTSSTGANSHVKYCTLCNGKSPTIKKCTYNANNVCTVCGTPYGVQPYILQ